MNSSSSKIIKIPIRIIESIYGKGNLDDAGDDLIEVIASCSDFPNQIKYKFEIESGNDNPWYHSLIVNVNITKEKQINCIVKGINRLNLNEIQVD